MKVGPDYVEPQRGHMEPTTWGEIQVGHIVRDKNDHFWTVDACDQVTVTLVPARHEDPVKSIRRPAADRPVYIYVPSEQEALNLLDKELGARVLREYEEREHTKARQLTWRMEPLSAKAADIRDHIDMIHGVKVDDVLRRWRGTEANPADKKSRAAALAELREAHQEMHDDPATWPMAFPHIHTLEAS